MSADKVPGVATVSGAQPSQPLGKEAPQIHRASWQHLQMRRRAPRACLPAAQVRRWFGAAIRSPAIWKHLHLLPNPASLEAGGYTFACSSLDTMMLLTQQELSRMAPAVAVLH